MSEVNQVIDSVTKIPAYERIITGVDKNKTETTILINDNVIEHVMVLLLVDGSALALSTEKGQKSYLVHKMRVVNEAKQLYDNVNELLVAESVIGTLLHEANTINSISGNSVSDAEQAFKELVRDAILKGASDIYVLKTAGLSYYRFQINKQVSKKYEISPVHAIALMRSAYFLADTDTKADTGFSENDQQDVSITLTIDNRLVKLRFQTMQIWPQGVEMILRVHADNMSSVATLDKVDLEASGFHPIHVKKIKKAIMLPEGLLVVAGPTGSGKTTTLKDLIILIDKLRNGSYMIRTIEDPPEFRIPVANQTPVKKHKKNDKNTASSDPYADAVRASFRSAFHVMMLGEIRDSVICKYLQQIVESGHQSLTTVHANSALGIANRLLGLGIEPDVLFAPGFISAFMYQRLMQKLCSHCAIPLLDHPDRDDLVGDFQEEIEDVSHLLKVRNVHGCKHCNGGTLGLTAVAEIIMPDDELLRLLSNRHQIEAKKYWLSTPDNFSVRTHAMSKVLKGEVGIDNYIYTFGYPNASDVEEANKLIKLDNTKDRDKESRESTINRVG